MLETTTIYQKYMAEKYVSAALIIIIITIMKIAFCVNEIEKISKSPMASNSFGILFVCVCVCVWMMFYFFLLF